MTDFIKGPAATLDYSFDWSPYLGTDTITASSWTVPAGITGSNQAFTTTGTSIRLTGGSIGVEYVVVNSVTMLSGQVDQRAFTIRIGLQ